MLNMLSFTFFAICKFCASSPKENLPLFVACVNGIKKADFLYNVITTDASDCVIVKSQLQSVILT